ERCLQVCTEAAGMLEGMGASRQAAAAWRELGEMQRELGAVEQALDSFDRALRAVRDASAAAVSPRQPSDIEDCRLTLSGRNLSGYSLSGRNLRDHSLSRHSLSRHNLSGLDPIRGRQWTCPTPPTSAVGDLVWPGAQNP